MFPEEELINSALQEWKIIEIQIVALNLTICPNNEMVLRQIVKQKAELMFSKDARLTDLEMSLSWKKF